LALAKGKAEKKCVLLDFTGSDWCGPCIEMKKVVFSKPEFATYADKNLVLVEVDSPHHKSQPEELKQQNERLKKQYGVDKSGWPTVVLLDPDGKILGRIEGYNGQKPADIIAWASKLAASRK
jgi:thioredoxin-related protein